MPMRCKKGFLKALAEQPASGQVASTSAPETAQTGNLPSESATGEAAQTNLTNQQKFRQLQIQLVNQA